MDSLQRQYYERALGAGMFVSPETENGLVGYSEPLRRFIQHEGYSPQVNEIANKMPSWIPGDDYMIDFRKGDPYTKVDEGYARLPGAGYEALHPELEGVNPEDYPDITKLSILADVAPYSREYNKYRNIVDKESRGNPELRSRYEQILEQMRQTRESTLQVDERRFDAPVDQIEGTVKSASFGGVELAGGGQCHSYLVSPPSTHKNLPRAPKRDPRRLSCIPGVPELHTPIPRSPSSTHGQPGSLPAQPSSRRRMGLERPDLSPPKLWKSHPRGRGIPLHRFLQLEAGKPHVPGKPWGLIYHFPHPKSRKAP
jgi:hypothetical protein